jgi:hypothetical protein
MITGYTEPPILFLKGAKDEGKSQKGKDCAAGMEQSTNDQTHGIHDGFQILTFSQG